MASPVVNPSEHAPEAAPAAPRIGRVVHKGDFQRLLSSPLRWRSAHFAVQRVDGHPTPPARPAAKAAAAELSTSRPTFATEPVDNTGASSASGLRHWLGTVCPKRLARRSVTRNVLRRQIRAAAERQAARLPPGLWLVRLRAPFDKSTFVSADSPVLRRTARAELDALFRSITQA